MTHPAARAALALLLAGCGRSEPSGPALAAQQVALDGGVTVQARLEIPESRAPGAAIGVHVTLRNRTATTKQIRVGSSSCTIFVRLLAAAPGAGASATFYDDFQRPCTRDLRHVTLAPGGSQVLHHTVPLAAIAGSAPDQLQAHIGLRLDDEDVLLHAGPFRLP